MSYIIIGTGEDGCEFRASDFDYDTVDEAFADLPTVEEHFPDARLKIEELRDMSYYMQQHQERFENDTADLY